MEYVVYGCIFGLVVSVISLFIMVVNQNDTRNAEIELKFNALRREIDGLRISINGESKLDKYTDYEARNRSIIKSLERLKQEKQQQLRINKDLTLLISKCLSPSFMKDIELVIKTDCPEGTQLFRIYADEYSVKANLGFNERESNHFELKVLIDRADELKNLQSKLCKPKCSAKKIKKG